LVRRPVVWFRNSDKNVTIAIFIAVDVRATSREKSCLAPSMTLGGMVKKGNELQPRIGGPGGNFGGELRIDGMCVAK
jgi:hypothetical protein